MFRMLDKAYRLDFVEDGIKEIVEDMFTSIYIPGSSVLRQATADITYMLV